VTVRGLSTTYRNARTELKALTGIDLQIMRGETLGLVGESGSGKTTLARALLGLVQPDPGSVIEFDGAPLPADLRRLNGQRVVILRTLMLRDFEVKSFVGIHFSSLTCRTARAKSLKLTLDLPPRTGSSRNAERCHVLSSTRPRGSMVNRPIAPATVLVSPNLLGGYKKRSTRSPTR
jgi:peptide/nickel transport system ATP-binding protein